MKLWLGRLLRLLWPLVLVRIVLAEFHDFYLLLATTAFLLIGLLVGVVAVIWHRQPMILLSFLLIPAYFAFQMAFPEVVSSIVENSIIAGDELLLTIDPSHFATCRERAAATGVAICRRSADEASVDVIFYDAEDQILLSPPQRTAAWKKKVTALGDDAPFTQCRYEVRPLDGHFYRILFLYDWPAAPL